MRDSLFPDLPCEIIDCHIHPPFPAERDMSWFSPVTSEEAFVSDMRRAGIGRR